MKSFALGLQGFSSIIVPSFSIKYRVSVSLELGFYCFSVQVLYASHYFTSMQSMKKSECPKELEPTDRRTSVRLNLTRRDENYPVCLLFIVISFEFVFYLYI